MEKDQTSFCLLIIKEGITFELFKILGRYWYWVDLKWILSAFTLQMEIKWNACKTEALLDYTTLNSEVKQRRLSRLVRLCLALIWRRLSPSSAGGGQRRQAAGLNAAPAPVLRTSPCHTWPPTTLPPTTLTPTHRLTTRYMWYEQYS